MPELPEVETTCRGIAPHVIGARVAEVIIRRDDLRQPISGNLDTITRRGIISVSRRSKYLLLGIDDGRTLLIHLGMSGSLRVLSPSDEMKKHDHVGITLGQNKQLRFHDPRRFGLILLLDGDPHEHSLLKNLGPEPLGENFTTACLKAACAKRSAAIKQVIMDGKVVVGVGNIYASESLFRAGIDPRIPAKRISNAKIAKLVDAIRAVLADAIAEGGTTLRDFLNSEGQPGYFKQRLFVYERKGQKCRVCASEIQHAVIGQRSTYWCPQCQK